MNMLCNVVKDSDQYSSILTSIRSTVEQSELLTLSTVVPDVRRIVPVSQLSNRNSHVVGDAGMIRMTQIIRNFLQATASPEKPLVLLLDDLQWADDSSRTLLRSFFGDRQLSNILLIGTLRDGENKTFEVPPDNVLPCHRIECDNFQVSEVTELVAGAIDWTTEEAEY